MVEIAARVENFELPSTSGKRFSLQECSGKKLLIYFYPKDNTPGCTTQAQGFRDLYEEFVAAECVLIGVSRDSIRSHENFKAAQNLPFELLSDGDEALCAQFSVIKEKMLYGKPGRGIERSTFLIDRQGVLRHEWRAVKVPGHVQEVLDLVKTLD